MHWKPESKFAKLLQQKQNIIFENEYTKRQTNINQCISNIKSFEQRNDNLEIIIQRNSHDLVQCKNGRQSIGATNCNNNDELKSMAIKAYQLCITENEYVKNINKENIEKSLNNKLIENLKAKSFK